MGKFAYFPNELFLLLVTFNFKYLFKTQNQEDSSYNSNCLSILYFTHLLRIHLTLVLIHQGHCSFDILYQFGESLQIIDNYSKQKKKNTITGNFKMFISLLYSYSGMSFYLLSNHLVREKTLILWEGELEAKRTKALWKAIIQIIGIK